MHPTISQILVTDHHRTLQTEADHARLAATARAHARAATPAVTEGQPRARRSVVRRLVDRLATA